jgi:hypothetical protein
MWARIRVDLAVMLGLSILLLSRLPLVLFDTVRLRLLWATPRLIISTFISPDFLNTSSLMGFLGLSTVNMTGPTEDVSFTIRQAHDTNHRLDY